MDPSTRPLPLKISAEIQKSGPMTFARFMELALYDSEHGYYMTWGGEANRPPKGASPIGFDGDFYTAVCLHPLLAKALVRQVMEIDALLGSPASLTVVEMGPGDGTLARDILAECAAVAPDLFQRLTYLLIERSPALRHLQEETLSHLSQHPHRIAWVTSLEALSEQSVVGVVLSNELIDAFPVHRVRMTQDGLKEIHVHDQAGRFVERLCEPSTPDLLRFFQDQGVTLTDGYTTEVNLLALKWMHEVAGVLKQGVVLTIDYGHTAQDYFSQSRSTGTLRCYRSHQVTNDPYQYVGEQDMTAHVNFSSLALAGEQKGLATTGFTNLMSFLMSLGIDEMLDGEDPEGEAIKSATQLLRPHGMGTTFKVLIQHKEVSCPSLRGLTHRPFFDQVLTGEQVREA